ncbi:Amino-acid carrier protein AlsT [Streptomyces sp. ADI95-16]|nr:Amino-acid carrier protein AlsT [Streptomyces sp. ADI95-16]
MWIADGSVSGGPMHYLPKSLADRFGAKGMKLGKVLGALAPAMILLFGLFGGNLFQVNQSYPRLVSVAGRRQRHHGLLGRRLHRRLPDRHPGQRLRRPGRGLHDRRGRLQPAGRRRRCPRALIIRFKRAAFSNEAGLGSAPIAHSAVKTKYPASEGLVALLEPFMDTVVICTMTPLTIIVANPASWGEARKGEGVGGVTITSDAFGTVLPWLPYISPSR